VKLEKRLDVEREAERWSSKLPLLIDQRLRLD
jgi:hypothetical protein